MYNIYDPAWNEVNGETGMGGGVGRGWKKKKPDNYRRRIIAELVTSGARALLDWTSYPFAPLYRR